MKPIKYTEKVYLVNDSPVFLMSGEFHYFRVPKKDWRTRMQLFKEAGGNCLATYIPWLLHEPQEGIFKFGESAEWLDLEGYLLTALEMDLYVIARPGAYQYSELIYDGLPGWLCENYPQILARNFHNQVFRNSSVSYVHPLFLEKLGHWFDIICPILKRYTASNGGPIVFIQLDNELTGIHRWFGSLDYNPESMGFGREDGRFPKFLRRRYEEITALNKAYQSTYDSFLEIPPPDPNQEISFTDIRRKKDYFEFYLETIAEYASWLAKKIRSFGIREPLVHNSANPVENSLFLETVHELKSDFILGSDHYYNLDQNWPQNHPTPQYAARCFYSLEMLRLLGYPPTVFEMPGGSASNWPPVTSHDAAAAYLVNLAFGMRGCNYYIFTGGPNPPNFGATTDLYDYGAGISAFGEIRPLYQAQKNFGEFLSENSWLASAERQVDFYLALDFGQTRASNYWQNRDLVLFSSPEAWDFCVKGVLTTALCASFSPAFINIHDPAMLVDTSLPLVVVSSSCMSRDAQKNIIKFIKRGGKVLLTPVLPVFDENFNPCSLLADFLGNPTFSQSTLFHSRPSIDGIFNILGTSYEFLTLPVNAEVVGSNELNGNVIAWKVNLPGNGEMIILGIKWLHSMYEHQQMLKKLLLRLGLNQRLHISNPNIWATLWCKHQKAGIFLMNLFTSPMETQVKVQLGTAGTIKDLGIHLIEPVSVKWISI